MIARFGDIAVGICCCHPPAPGIPMGGVIVTGDPTVLTNNLSTARTTDLVIGFCGHPGIIVSSSGVTFSSNLGVARLGDAVAGCLIASIAVTSFDSITS